MAQSEGSFDSIFQSGGTNVKVVYVLYLASLLSGVTGLVGLIMAYLNRGGGPDWTTSHYTYQIRTIWTGLAYVTLGVILAFVAVGFLLLAFVAVWFIVRCVRGLQFAAREEPMPEPATWLW